MMDLLSKLHFRPSLRTNSVTILVVGVVLLVLGLCGVGYWRYVETQTLHLLERNFRALTVTGQALANLVANYEAVFKSVIEGEPPCNGGPCPEEHRRRAYEEALLALQAFQDVNVTKEASENDAFVAEFASSIKLTYVHQDRRVPKTRWKIQAVLNIGTIMRQLVTEDIFSDVLLADSAGKVLHQQSSKRDGSGFVFEHVANLLKQAKESEPKAKDDNQLGTPRGENGSLPLPLFNDAPVGGISYKVFAQATILPAHPGTTQTLILVGIVPAGHFHTEARAIPLNNLLLIVWFMLAVFLVLPYAKLRTNLPTERLTPISVTVLVLSTILGTTVLTFGLADITTYWNMEQHLTAQVKRVSSNIADRFDDDVQRGLKQLTAFDESCWLLEKCWNNIAVSPNKAHNQSHPAKRLCIGDAEGRFSFFTRELNVCVIDKAKVVLKLKDGTTVTSVFNACQQFSLCKESMKFDPTWTDWAQRVCIGAKGRFLFLPIASDHCFIDETVSDEKGTATVETNDVNTMLWIGPKGALQALWSREPAPWKRVTLEEREYVRRIWKNETFTSGETKFWIEPIFSWTTGGNYAVFSMKSNAQQVPDSRYTDQPVVAALEVKLPSVTDVGVPPGIGFAIINQEGEVLFHSDSRRNLRENLFEETDRDGRLRQAVFARATDQFDGRYWGKDRHFHITPLFKSTIKESPDVHWSLVTYWDLDLLRFVNFRALFSSGALFLIYSIVALSIGLLGWWIASTMQDKRCGWMWPQPKYVPQYEGVIWLLLFTLGAVGLWAVRPHSRIDMLVWAMVPLLGVVVAFFFCIIRIKSDPADNTSTDESGWSKCRRSYTLLLLLILLTVAVMPALVFFQAAVNVEWRLLAKFSQFDLLQDRAIQAQKVREFYRQTLFDEAGTSGGIRERFLAQRAHPANSDPPYAYVNFPFESCWEKCGKNASSSVDGKYEWIKPLLQMSQTWYHIIDRFLGIQLRWDEFLIHTLYRVIDRPRAGQGEIETDFFPKPSTQWQEPTWGVMRLADPFSGSDSSISLQSQIPSPIPEWLYSLLVFGSVIPLVAFGFKTSYARYVLIAAACVIAGFLWFGGVGLALAVLGICAVLYWTNCVLPRLAVQRVLLLDFPYPTNDSRPLDNAQLNLPYSVADLRPTNEQPSSWPVGLYDVFRNEASVLDNVSIAGISRPSELSTHCGELLKEKITEDFDVAKERIIREILKAIKEYYVQIWEACAESQRRALFNLARDGFLHSRNPDIASLMEKGLIVADPKLRLMNESFRRFLVTTGFNEHLDEDIAEAQVSTLGQVWRPIGAGLLLVMLFLVMTQEQYRTVTGAFLGVLPGLLGALSQILPASKKERPEPAPSA